MGRDRIGLDGMAARTCIYAKLISFTVPSLRV